MSTSAPPKLDQPLPTTPSAEWADKAHAALHEQQPALVPVTLAFSATAPSVASPILEVPGAFPPEDLSASTAEHGPSVGAKESLHNTAEAYIAPERLDQVEHLVEGVGSTAARYVPTSVSSAVSNYWCEWKPSKSVSRVILAVERRVRRRGRGDRVWRAIGWVIVLWAWLLWGGGKLSSFSFNLFAHRWFCT